jgi:hypothetical protein
VAKPAARALCTARAQKDRLFIIFFQLKGLPATKIDQTSSGLKVFLFWNHRIGETGPGQNRRLSPNGALELKIWMSF